MLAREVVNKSVLLLLVLGISALFLTMISQFLMPLFMAGLFSAIVHPTHRWLSQKLGGRTNISAIILLIGIVVLVMVPLTILIGVVVSQAISVGQSVTPWVQTFINEPSVLTQYIAKIPYAEHILPYREMLIEKAGQIVGIVTTFLIDNLNSGAKLTVNAIFSTVIMLYTMFYFLNTGKVLLDKILYFLPLHDRDEQLLLNRFTSVTTATLKGTLIIGIMQGTICGLAFALAGIHASVFWGTVMAVMSIVPAFGTAIIWLPALIILALSGDITGVLILAILCGAVAGNLDNVIRPRLVGKDTEMHDLFVLFGTLGGITMFGILGIIIGPIVAALFISLWEIYGKAFHAYLPEVGVSLKHSSNQPESNEEQGKGELQENQEVVKDTDDPKTE
ncbi:AI-2E family transporter [Desulfogranum japonicum]|uniref:AI-2E family transporter n=1 Tax=Desulfogranum japonicum TaxID=231447 RepID=UPI000413F2F8|nr:AI-2E family transporter [Desulfogranum japonicum]